MFSALQLYNKMSFSQQNECLRGQTRSFSYFSRKISLKKKNTSDLNVKAQRIFSNYSINKSPSNDFLSRFSPNKEYMRPSKTFVILQSSCVNSFCQLFEETSKKCSDKDTFSKIGQLSLPTVESLSSSFVNQSSALQSLDTYLISHISASRQKKCNSYLVNQNVCSIQQYKNSLAEKLTPHILKENNHFQGFNGHNRSYGVNFKAKFMMKKMNEDTKIKQVLLKEKTLIQKTLAQNVKQNILSQQLIEAGCTCLPQCFWIDKWLRLIKSQFDENNSKTNLNPNLKRNIQRQTTIIEQKWPYFKNAKQQNNLKEVLSKYFFINSQLEDIQGISLIAAVIVFHSNNPTMSCHILNFIMKQMKFENIYEGDSALSLSQVKKLLSSLEIYQHELYSHIVKSGIELELQIRTLFVTMFGSFIPLEFIHLIIDKFIKKGFQGLNQILLSLLIFLKDKIFQLNSQQIWRIFTIDWLSEHVSNIDWIQLIGFSGNIAQTSTYS